MANNRFRLLGSGFALLATTCLAAPAWAETNFYVDPVRGDDRASGATVAEAFRTLERAQQAVRTVAGSMNDDVVVNLRGGTYSLTAPLTLGPADSGSNGHQVIWKAYAGEVPVVTSARRIVGWRAVDNGRYRATIGNFDFRQMYVNGVRATRSRNPEVGSWGQLFAFDGPAKSLSITGALTNKLSGPGKVEVNLLLQWGENYMRLADIAKGPSATTVTLKDAEAGILFERPWPYVRLTAPLYLENAFDFVTHPGEFYVSSREGAVYYIPRAGEDMTTASVIAPTLETLVDIRGASLDAPAHDIRFSGVTFADTTWMYASKNGMLNGQGGLYNLSANMQNQQFVGRPPAAVHVELADRVQFDGNTVTRAGATGLDIDRGVHDSQVVGNTVYNVAGNGIMIGKFSDPDVEFHTVYDPPNSPAGEDTREVTRDVDVLNNMVTGVGLDYYGVAGINAGFVNTVNIRHNDISNSPWAGVSLGWGWQVQQNALGNNHVDRNAISNVVNIMCDTAGVYHLSNDPGTTIDYNYVHDIRRTASACGTAVVGLYLDEGSANLSLSNNVVHSYDGDMLFLNINGPNNVVENNLTDGADTIRAAGLERGYESLRNRLNLAYNRPATASSSASGMAAGAGADGDVSTGWAPLATDKSGWWQVDFGQAQQLSQVSIATRQDSDQPDARTNFEVQVSNDRTFGTYTVVARKDEPMPFAGTMTQHVRDHGAYRYLRVAKIGSGDLFIGDVTVMPGGGEIVTNPVPAFDPNRFYTIKNVSTGKVLSIKDGSTNEAAAVVQRKNTRGTDQQFRLIRVSGNLFEIVARNSGMALDVSGASKSLGANVIQYPFRNKGNQLWYFQAAPKGKWVIRNFLSDQVMNVREGSSSDGAAIEQWTNVTEENQRWIIE